MLTIAICDDSPLFLESSCALASELASSILEEEFQILQFANAFDMLSHMEEEGPFDLLLCDVLMPGINGIEAVRELRTELKYDGPVIFLTTSSDFALEAFGVRAAGYLLKPLDRAMFNSVVGDVLSRIARDHEAGRISIKDHDELVHIRYADIIYVEGIGTGNQVIHLQSGKRVGCRSSQKKLFERLNDSRFFRLGASFIINLNAVEIIKGDEVTLTDGSVLPIPKRVITSLREAFANR